MGHSITDRGDRKSKGTEMKLSREVIPLSRGRVHCFRRGWRGGLRQ